MAEVVEQKNKDEISEMAWCAYQQNPECTGAGNPWAWIAADVVAPDGKLPLQPHKVVRTELYNALFLSLLYWLQHDYNESAAETLGLFDDHGHGVDWAWDATSRRFPSDGTARIPLRSGTRAAAIRSRRTTTWC